MVKRAALSAQVREAATAQGMTFELIRSTGGHDVFSLDGLRIPIPRHREVGPKVAFEIRAECEPKLGKRWWR